VALGLALRAPLLTRGFHFDELNSVINFIEAPSAWDTISRVSAFNNHPFYSLLARGAEALFGRAEWVVRLPALLFGLVTPPLLWFSLRRATGRRPALLAALLLATSSVHIGFSASARGSTGLVFFTWLSSVLFLALLRGTRDRSRLLAYSLVTALGLWIHLYAAAVFVVQGLILVLVALGEARERGLRNVLTRYGTIAGGMAGAALLALLCYAPALRRMAPELLTSHPHAFMPLLPLAVLSYLAGRGMTPGGFLLVAVALAGLLLGLRGRRLEGRYVALLFTLPLLGNWLTHQDTYRTRFFVFLLPFFVLGLALATEALWRWANQVPGRARAAARASSLAVLALPAWLWVSRPWSNVPRGGFREATAALEAPAARQGARIGRCAIGLGDTFYAWYATRPILIPTSVAEFEAFLAANDEVRCAWMDGIGNTPAHDSIGALLEHRCGPAEPYHVLQVYRCHKEAR
jgi:hypothetical protein